MYSGEGWAAEIRSTRSLRLVVSILAALIMSAVLNSSAFQTAASSPVSVQNKDKLNDPKFIAEGARLFSTSCANAYCHGVGGKGGGAPRLRGKGLEPSFLFKSISNGIGGTGMLSFKSELSEEQIWKIIAF